MSNTYGFDYKVLEGDNYEKLANIFGISALTNAGIFPDSDIKTNSVIKFRNLYLKDAEFLNKKGNDHTNEYNRARDLKFIKENRHYLNTEGFLQGISDMLQKSDEELIPIYKGILSRALQEEKARAVQAEKSRILAERSKERAEHNARLRALGIVNEETAQYSPEMKHHKGREQIAAVTNNYNNPMARGAGVVSKDVDLSFEGSMENLENQHKITEEIKDLTLKAAFGAVGLAGATALAPIVAPAVVDSVAVNGASTVANNPIVLGVTNKLVKPVGNFVLKQIPWIAGSHAANKGLDVIAGNTKDHYDPEHWANNRYIRGGATAIGMAGGTAGAKLIGGTGKVALGTATGKYGLDYAQNLIARYFRNVGKNTIGLFIPSLFTMEGLAASNHVMDTVEEKRKNENKDNLEYIQNEEYKISPYARAAVNTVGMWLGHNASRSTLQQTKDIIGNEINSAIKNAVKFESEGNLQAALNYIQRALKLERTLNNGLFSKALDVRGMGTNPWLGSAIEHLPVGIAMQAGAFGEDVLDTEILNNPIVLAALVKGVGHSLKSFLNAALNYKIRSRLKGTLAEVVEALKTNNTDATGTYGIKLYDKSGKISPNIAKHLFPNKPLHEITPEMVNLKIKALSPEQLSDFLKIVRSPTFHHYDKSYGEKGYLNTEHNQGVNNEFFISGKNVNQHVSLILPENPTLPQLYAAIATKAGARHGSGFKYGTMIPKESLGVNLKDATFVDSQGTQQPLFVKVGRNTVLNPKFNTNLSFRGMDSYLGMKDGKMFFSNVAGHVGNVISTKDANGQPQYFKIGIDTPGYGDTAGRYKGGAVKLGSILGKALDYFTPRPYYTVWAEALGNDAGVFGTTGHVQAGKYKPIKTKTRTVYMTGSAPITYEVPASLRDRLLLKQNKVIELRRTPLGQQKTEQSKTLEAIDRYLKISKINSTMKTSFKEGNLSKIYSQIRKTFSKTVLPDVEYSRKVLDFLEQHPSKTKQYRELYEDLHEYVSQHDITQHFANYKHGGLIGLKNIGF